MTKTIDEKITEKKAQIEKYQRLVAKKQLQLARLERKKAKAIQTAQSLELKAKEAGLPSEVKQV